MNNNKEKDQLILNKIKFRIKKISKKSDFIEKEIIKNFTIDNKIFKNSTFEKIKRDICNL